MSVFLKKTGFFWVVGVLLCIEGYSQPVTGLGQERKESPRVETSAKPKVEISSSALPVVKNLKAGGQMTVTKNSSGKVTLIEIKNSKGELRKTATQVSPNMWHFKGDGEEGFLTQISPSQAYFNGAMTDGSPIDLKFSMDSPSGSFKVIDPQGVETVYTPAQAEEGISEPGIAGVVGLSFTVVRA